LYGKLGSGTDSINGGLPAKAARKNLGESGKNFIVIGKKPNVQETMLKVAVLMRKTKFRNVGGNNAKTQTWKE
jgi:hypothetical protein